MERLQTLIDAQLAPDEARQEAIAALRRAVHFGRWCWPLTDPASALSVSGIGEVDFWPALSRLVALEHGGDVTSKPRLVQAERASVALSAATRGDLARSRRWRECLSPYGIGDELMTACRDRHGCWASVELMRDGADPQFDEHDQRLLHEAAPTLGALVRGSISRVRRPSAGSYLLPPGVLILDAELRPVSQTRSFREWVARLPSAGPDPEMLPPAVFEIGARAAGEAGSGLQLSNSVRIPCVDGGWAVLEGASLDGDGAGAVAITARAAVAAEVFDLLCRVYALTPRERQLSGLVLEGLATSQLAETLSISAYTVQDHLKAIFLKTGTNSRRGLSVRLAGHDSGLARPHVGGSSAGDELSSCGHSRP